MAYTTIDNPVEYFNTKLYTGNGSTQTITGLNFAPEFVWLKDRGSGGYSHAVFDKVRGVQKRIFTNLTNAEDTASDTLTAFNSDGFTLGSNVGINGSSNNQVSWNWLANGAGVSNTSGTITSTVSANTTAGFSIVSYTGNGTANATVGHGLGVTPKMIITRNRNNTTATNWSVYHVSLSTNNQITLNQTDAQNLPSPLMVTTVGSSTYTLGSSRREINQSSDTYIAYCFADIKGYSKFGSYTGNGSTDGTFIYTGFKPAFVLVKNSSVANDWIIWDSKRNTFNVVNTKLSPNTSSADFTDTSAVGIDLLCNGFKLKGTDGAVNGSGSTHIYMAFAENPFVSSTGIPCTAR